MSYTRFMTPDPIHTFNASHSDAEIKNWLTESEATKAAEEAITQLDLPLSPTDATATAASEVDGSITSTSSEASSTQV